MRKTKKTKRSVMVLLNKSLTKSKDFTIESPNYPNYKARLKKRFDTSSEIEVSLFTPKDSDLDTDSVSGQTFI